MNDLHHPCEPWAEPISMAAAGCLPPGEEQKVRAHLETCRDCRERFRQLTDLCAMLAELPLPTNGAETAIIQQVMSQVTSGNPPDGTPPDGAPFPGIVIHGTSDQAPLYYPFGSFLFSYVLAAAIIGVGMLIGWACKVSVYEQVANIPPSAPAPAVPSLAVPELVFVGRVTGLVDSRWSDANSGTVENALVPLRRTYALASGLMKITYDTGAVVILEGPCTYTVESKAGGYLGLGRLTAKVGKRGRQRDRETGREEDRKLSASLTVGQSNLQVSPSPPLPISSPRSSLFAVRTPTATVTDLGTEFGVEVDKSGQTESHVFRGKVRLAVAGSDDQDHDRVITLSAHESARTEKVAGSEAGVVRRGATATDPASFVRGEQFTARAQEVKELPLKPFRRWQAFSEQLRKRSDLLAYYDFQRDPGNKRDHDGYELLRNRAATGSKFDGRLVGATTMGMAQGRFRGKDALQFNFSGDGVRINIPGEFPQLTFMVAMSLERSSPAGILMTDGYGPGQVQFFHWQLVKSGTMKFSFPVVGAVFQCDSSEAADLAQWHLWTIVYDVPGGRAASYVDGRLLKEWKMTKGPVAKIGEATIGNWKPFAKYVPRPLCGAIDEFVIFSRALGDADIKQLQVGDSGTEQK